MSVVFGQESFDLFVKFLDRYPNSIVFEQEMSNKATEVQIQYAVALLADELKVYKSVKDDIRPLAHTIYGIYKKGE